jgi:hypothetical protein
VFGQDDGSVWFTDGGRPRLVAESACPEIVTGESGPRAVWFDCSSGGRGTLVVHDTGSGRSTRHPIASCRPTWSGCTPDAVIGEHVYFTRGWASGPRHHGRMVYRQSRLDVPTGTVTPVPPQALAEDLQNHPRAMVLGDSWRAGTPTVKPDFGVVGARLVPVDQQPGPEPRRVRAFDTATGKPVRLRLPETYHPEPAAAFHGNEVVGTFTRFSVFAWLDDDTVALAQVGEEPMVGDIVVCHLARGRCRLVAAAPPSDHARVLPGGPLPG